MGYKSSHIPLYKWRQGSDVTSVSLSALYHGKVTFTMIPWSLHQGHGHTHTHTVQFRHAACHTNRVCINNTFKSSDPHKNPKHTHTHTQNAEGSDWLVAEGLVYVTRCDWQISQHLMKSPSQQWSSIYGLFLCNLSQIAVGILLSLHSLQVFFLDQDVNTFLEQTEDDHNY